MGLDSAPPVPHEWEQAAPSPPSEQLCRERVHSSQGGGLAPGTASGAGLCALCQCQWLPRARCHRAAHLLEGFFSWQRRRGFVSST